MRLPTGPAAVAVLATLIIAGCAGAPRPLRLATTTSVDNSGLLEAILPAFRADTGLDVQVLVVGSGRALALLRRRDADAAITHDPAAERLLLDEGGVSRYRKIMYNDFLIVGPPEDPAGVRGAPDAAQAMGRIARSASSFVSRGDASGTHAREQQLWTRAGTSPAPERWLETGQGMAATLRVASERRAYTLADRASYVQLASRLVLAPLVEGGPELLNTYAVIVMRGDPAQEPHARRLAEWLSGGAGRGHILAFGASHGAAFSTWPADIPADAPEALPR